MTFRNLTKAKLQVLIESANEVTSETNLDALLAKILNRAGELTNSPRGSIILKHPGREELYFASASGKEADVVMAKFGKYSIDAIPIKGSVAGDVFSSNIPKIENRMTKYFSGVDEKSKKKTESMICVPLTIGRKTIGVMQLLDKKEKYKNEHVLLLESLASQAAISIRNASLFEDLMAHSGFYYKNSDNKTLEKIVAEFDAPAKIEELTIFFADMRGFTQLSQSLRDPATVQSFINELVSMLADEVILQEGIVNKFLGDGIMAIFREKNHSERAVYAAFKIIEKFQSLKKDWDDRVPQDLGFLDIGIGIVADDCIVGAMGSEKVKDFTAIGTPVNLAAAYVMDARNGKRVLVDHNVYNAVSEIVDWDQLPSHKLTKKGQNVRVDYKKYWLKNLKKVASERVFISHNSNDYEEIMEKLVSPLNDRGVEVYISEENRVGSSWPREIQNELYKATWIVVIVSENSINSHWKNGNSDWVSEEVDLVKSLQMHEGKILPIRFDTTDVEKVNLWLKPLHYINAWDADDLGEVVFDVIFSDRTPNGS